MNKFRLIGGCYIIVHHFLTLWKVVCACLGSLLLPARCQQPQISRCRRLWSQKVMLNCGQYSFNIFNTMLSSIYKCHV